MKSIPRWVYELNRSLWKRLIFFFALSLAAVYLSGYHFGTFDQVFHIPFLKASLDPSLYPGDPFVGLREYHFSYFWQIFIPFYRIGQLEPAMFVIHLLITWLTFWGFWEICQTVFKDPLANVLLSFALVVPHIGFPGFQIIEFSLLNRTFALPFLLFAINFYLKKNLIPAFVLVGIMFNFHLLYAGFVMAMFGMDSLLNLRRAEWRELLLAGLGFALTALPIFLRKSGVDSGFDLTLRPEMAYLESMSMAYNVYFPVGPQPYVWLGTLQGLACLALILLAMKDRKGETVDKRVCGFLWGIATLILIGSVASYALPVTFIIQLQLIRVGVFLLYFAYVYGAGSIAKLITTRENDKQSALALVLSFVLAVVPLIPLVILIVNKFKRTKLVNSITLSLLGLVLLTQIPLAIRGKYLAPGYHVYGPQTEWRKVQDWARENTPKDARFITPPYEYWQYEADWRVFSERSTLATIPEIEVLHLHPPYQTGFVRRFSAIAPGVLARLDGDYNHTLASTKAAYLSLGDADFTRIADAFEIGYLVLPNEKKSGFKLLYQNAAYSLYELP